MKYPHERPKYASRKISRAPTNKRRFIRSLTNRAVLSITNHDRGAYRVETKVIFVHHCLNSFGLVLDVSPDLTPFLDLQVPVSAICHVSMEICCCTGVQPTKQREWGAVIFSTLMHRSSRVSTGSPSLPCPEELFLYILSFLDYQDLAHLGLVCKEWRRLTQDQVNNWKLIICITGNFSIGGSALRVALVNFYVISLLFHSYIQQISFELLKN